jgi:uncharacterized protein (TIGR02391 family)
MNLETAIESRLWQAVRADIEDRKYTEAILDAVHLLTDTIRSRSGLDGDGVALVGQAFGGSSPKLKVNRLQTESEQNVQKGIEAILRGLYQAIRNPRSHDKHEDDEPTATALIIFIDYLLRIVDKSGGPMSLSAIVARVIDPAFVASNKYAGLVVEEIPANRRFSACREVFARRFEQEWSKLQFFFTAILEKLSPAEIEEFAGIVSQELRETTDQESVRSVLSALPSIWPKLDEIARIRIENMIIESVREGKWVRKSDRLLAGHLGTWITTIIDHLTLKRELWSEVSRKLGSSNIGEQDYALQYFMPYVEGQYKAPPPSLCAIVNKHLRAGDVRFKELAESWARDVDFDEGPIERPVDHHWRAPFIEALENFTESKPGFEDPEDVPF